VLQRRVAIVVPVKDEADRLASCLTALTNLELDARIASVIIVVLANNCTDGSAALARQFSQTSPLPIHVKEVALESARANAGWARRLAFDEGANRLLAKHDILVSTDADTRPQRDWLIKTFDHLDQGLEAVAGFARLDPRELRKLDKRHRRRLSAIRRYEDALNYLKSFQAADEPWPRHFYEGGASMAVTLGAYEAIGRAPTPPVGEDKALFDALRRYGIRIRHPKDVRVLTSCRFSGRAPAGAADTLARWVEQDDDDSLWGVSSVTALFDGDVTNDQPVSFKTLSAETELARALVRTIRSSNGLSLAS
jgi:glycosyltransferase involved in cell wall biosynthesis